MIDLVITKCDNILNMLSMRGEEKSYGEEKEE